MLEDSGTINHIFDVDEKEYAEYETQYEAHKGSIEDIMPIVKAARGSTTWWWTSCR